ncbi:MAG: glycosyltransferase [Atribacterota bacterium]
MSKKILVIPGTSIENIRKRQTQIAIALSEYYDVYILKWNEGYNTNFFVRVKNTLKDLFKKTKVYKENGINYAEFPFFHRPLFKIKWFNPWYMKRFIKKYDIDIVLNGVHYFFWTPDKDKVNVKHIFDINDLPSEDTGSKIEKFRYEFAKHEIDKADIITACSKGLVEYIQKEYGRKPIFIPNGTYLDKFSKVTKLQTDEIKRNYDMQGKFILGYIGFIGDWIDVDFMVDFLKEFKKEKEDSALLVIGNGPKVKKYREKYNSKDIIFTGGIPSNEVSKYYKVLDAGLLPSKKSLFQDLAFHTKLIDYTAAQKMVLAAPLEEIKKLGFPNIITSELDIGRWIEKMNKIIDVGWREEWNNLVLGYDWKDIGKKFKKLINED